MKNRDSIDQYVLDNFDRIYSEKCHNQTNDKWHTGH